MSLKESQGSLQKQLAELFKQSLKAIVPTDDNLQPLVVRCFCSHVVGDYECNAISLFSKIKKIRPEFTSTEMIAEAIMKYLPESEMIQSSFVKSNRVIVVLSGKWLAKNIEKKLIKGIQSWAPRLPITRAVLHFIKPTDGDIMLGGRFRSTIISDSLTKILEFSGVHVLQRGHVEIVDDSNKQGGEPICPKASNQIRETSFESNKRCKGGEPICPKAPNQIRETSFESNKRCKGGEPICPKAPNQIRETSFESNKRCKVCNPDNPCVSDVYSDRAHHRYSKVISRYVNEEEADWIIFIANDELREGIRDIIDYAKVIGLHFEEDDAYPKVTHAAYRILIPNGELSDLQDSLADLSEAKNKARKALKEQDKDKRWSELKLDEVAEAAVRCFILKWDRLSNYVFTLDNMFDAEGNSGVNILHQYDSVCSIIRTLGYNEDEKQLVKELLKKGGLIVLDLEVQRRLGVHLLQFSEIVKDACSSLCPDIICKYLYHLTLMASIAASYINNIGVQKTRLQKRKQRLLFEATRAVMHKCLELLGITLADYYGFE